MMGGDYAPRVTIEGFRQALQLLPGDVSYYLFGDEEVVRPLVAEAGENVHPVVCSNHISMPDEPVKAFGAKKESSIVKGFEYLATGQIDVYCSAGNSGAVMVGATAVIGMVKGVIRPCITVPIPRENGGEIVLVDAGLNPECKAENLFQFALMGSLYAQYVKGIERPLVGLLNIGSEDGKGSPSMKHAFSLMKDSGLINFKGNVEGYDLFSPDCPDVVVCDGMVGNVILKYTEGLYSLLKKRNLTDSFVEYFNFETYGATPILGINKNVLLGHGVSTAAAVKSMICNSYLIAKSQINKKFINAFEYEKS
jgi:glycerol-3-phosphate acyltransferase PlsX